MECIGIYPVGEIADAGQPKQKRYDDDDDGDSDDDDEHDDIAIWLYDSMMIRWCDGAMIWVYDGMKNDEMMCLMMMRIFQSSSSRKGSHVRTSPRPVHGEESQADHAETKGAAVNPWMSLITP